MNFSGFLFPYYIYLFCHLPVLSLELSVMEFLVFTYRVSNYFRLSWIFCDMVSCYSCYNIGMNVYQVMLKDIGGKNAKSLV